MTEKFNFLGIFAQTSARYFFIYSILYGIFSMNYYLILMSVFGVINGVLNFGFKRAFEFLYNKLNVDTLPILGRGQRPVGFKNCSDVPTCEKIHSAFAFGMPSGHSQTAWFIFIYLVLYLNDTINEKKQDLTNSRKTYYNLWLGFSIVIGLIISIYISYSRVAVGCHTIQQVTLGGILGLIFGSVSYFISKVIINSQK
jgi:membrane-associated phospholipid phosphatase